MISRSLARLARQLLHQPGNNSAGLRSVWVLPWEGWGNGGGWTELSVLSSRSNFPPVQGNKHLEGVSIS